MSSNFSFMLVFSFSITINFSKFTGPQGISRGICAPVCSCKELYLRREGEQGEFFSIPIHLARALLQHCRGQTLTSRWLKVTMQDRRDPPLPLQTSQTF